MLVPAAGSAGAGVVAVPIETRYATANHPAQFRKSHFRLVRDLWQITSHVVRQVFGHGDVIAEYRRCRARPPVIDDPDGEFAAMQRSEERRVGKECVSPCRSRWAPHH